MEIQSKKAIEDIKARIDALPAIALFNERLEEKLTPDNKSNKFFITFDLDKFAAINDTYGYEVGDAVIYYAFDIMLEGFSNMMKDGHCLASRFGGDEMAFYVEGALEETVTRIIDTIIESIRTFDFNQYGCPRAMTSSCGTYAFTKVDHVQEPRHQAAKAFMEAKRLGGNQSVFYKE